MAGPFGQAPTFQEYLEWLRKTGNFYYTNGYIMGSEFTVIMDKNSKPIATSHIKWDARLTPIMVYRLDVKLNVDSPWPKTVT